jgi:hypothetical protein
LLRGWLELNPSTRLEKNILKDLASATNLTEYQVYDFLNHEKQKIKKRNRMSVNNI